eukprot:CAMPEP_0113659206 /NCGR_PEP_ID=MMETSP0017_2-20120614/32194_1 /TAXON_ID=2856 /ORGANISM="Cylindrotheca closterium" /LENGTH=144 /DNA_ID=CAMNT_0000573661 /DNA_START=45 /DNA_END=479 /DNA_ORIENTATION=+ /assembly_acc=CAM_ASM_000147
MSLTPESTAVTKYLFEALLSPHLGSLGLARWRFEVSDEMDRLLYHSATRSERVQHMEQVLVKLNRYVQMERLSLLELAVWKASMEVALLYPGKPNGCNEQDNKDIAGNGTDASEIRCVQDRANSRTLCGAQIVLSNVLRFLGDP